MAASQAGVMVEFVDVVWRGFGCGGFIPGYPRCFGINFCWVFFGGLGAYKVFWTNHNLVWRKENSWKYLVEIGDHANKRKWKIEIENIWVQRINFYVTNCSFGYHSSLFFAHILTQEPGVDLYVLCKRKAMSQVRQWNRSCSRKRNQKILARNCDDVQGVEELLIHD